MLWVFLLDVKGETKLISVIKMPAEHEERILQKMSALNTTVLRASRK